MLKARCCWEHSAYYLEMPRPQHSGCHGCSFCRRDKVRKSAKVSQPAEWLSHGANQAGLVPLLGREWSFLIGAGGGETRASLRRTPLQSPVQSSGSWVGAVTWGHRGATS